MQSSVNMTLDERQLACTLASLCIHKPEIFQGPCKEFLREKYGNDPHIFGIITMYMLEADITNNRHLSGIYDICKKHNNTDIPNIFSTYLSQRDKK